MARPLLVLTLAGLALAAPRVHAQEGRGDVRLGMAAGVDGNAPRAYTDAGGEGPDPDLGLSLRAAAEGETPVADGRAVLRGVWDAGARTYLRYGEERTLAQAASAEGAWLLGEGLALGLGGAAKDRRGGARPYTDLALGPFVDWTPGWLAGLDLRASVGAHRFIYRPQGEASHAGPTASLLLRHRPAARHTLSLLGAWERQRHAGPPRFEDGSADVGRRVDTTWVGRAGWGWRGPVRLSVGYAFERRLSNSFGQRAHTHRLNASAALRLPLRWSLLAQASLARSTYPDGVYLSPELVLAENDEGQDALSLRLVRALSPSLDLELTAGAWGTRLRLPDGDLRYRRVTGAVGLSWRPFAGREARPPTSPPPPAAPEEP